MTAIILFSGALVYFSALHEACTGGPCTGGQLSPEETRPLDDLGIPMGFYSAYVLALNLLVAAALFNPLRRRIRSLMDSRFYSSKYHAKKTLEDFSARLRDEIDLNRLSEDLLVVVVRETVQPEHTTLWWRERSREDVRA
jgi:hypothetical protein